MRRCRSDEPSSRQPAERAARRGGSFSLGMLVLGSFTWGIAIYCLKGQALPPVSCMALGAGLAFLAGNLWRRMYLITNLILPLLLIGYACRML